MTLSPSNAYLARYPALQRVARELEAFIAKHLAGASGIDRVSARAKDPIRFARKATKVSEQGSAKYVDPISQIQDQIGARVVVVYASDVDKTAERLQRYFQHIERRNHVPESDWEFGYFGSHWIFALPSDVIPPDVNTGLVPRFFELQIKTIFQHAWSEANHDIGYKPEAPLTSDQRRRFAFAASQAWGADRIFEDLRRELRSNGAV